jgi:hypothetical protein
MVKRKEHLKWTLTTKGVKAWTGFIWLKLETAGVLLWIGQWNFGIYKMRIICKKPDEKLSSQEGLSSIDLITIRRNMVTV